MSDYQQSFLNSYMQFTSLGRSSAPWIRQNGQKKYLASVTAGVIIPSVDVGGQRDFEHALPDPKGSDQVKLTI